MKKIISITLCYIFLTSAMGMTINSHYCGTNLKSISFIKESCCCEKKQECNCCKDKITHIKVKDSFTASAKTELHTQNIDLPVCNVQDYICLFKRHYFSSSPYHFTVHNELDRIILFRSLII